MAYKILYFILLIILNLNLSIQLSIGEITIKSIVQEDKNNQTESYKSINIDLENEDGFRWKKALEIYKIIMIFTCCVLAIILVCFLICILRNSESINSNTASTTNLANINDAFLTNDENSQITQNGFFINLNLPFEKPPSYLDALKEIGQPPPIYTRNPDQHENSIYPLNNQNLFATSVSRQDELILDCNRWLEQANSERTNLEARLVESRIARELRSIELRRLSRDSERRHLPNILSRCHSSPVIRNSLLLKNRELINLINNAPNNLLNNSSTTLINNLDQNQNLLSNQSNDHLTNNPSS